MRASYRLIGPSGYSLEHEDMLLGATDVSVGSFATGVVSAASLAMSALHRKRLNCCAATK
jgi:hypothetical protein